MPTSAELLLDTSAALALVVSNHPLRDAVVPRVRRKHLGLAGHSEIEFLSALTRLPEPHRLSAPLAAELISRMFPETYRLSADGSSTAIARLVGAGISGGAVYDGLVALAAREAGVPLLSCDRRALPTYAAIGVSVELI